MKNPDAAFMGGCQNYGPFMGTLNNKCRVIIRTQKGTLILTSRHITLIEACSKTLQELPDAAGLPNATPAKAVTRRHLGSRSWALAVHGALHKLNRVLGYFAVCPNLHGDSSGIVSLKVFWGIF